MKIFKLKNENKFVVENEEIIGELIFSYIDRDNISLDSIRISQEFRGKNLGVLIFKEFIKFVRENNLTVTPICSYAKKIFNKNLDQYKDILK